MTNEQMKAKRFQRWSQARKLVASIKECLAAGGVVQVCTALKATEYSGKHIEWFEARKNGAFVRHGKGFVCIDGCRIRYGRLVA